MTDSSGIAADSSRNNQGTESSSNSSSAARIVKSLTHNPPIKSEYCFEESRERETANARKLLDLPLNDKQYLVAKGILTKICRKKPKQRTFYLFNDALVYANISYGKLLSHPHTLNLEEVTIVDVTDSGIYGHGFIIESPKKSFAVYASLSEEKRRWIECISVFAEAARKAARQDAQREFSSLQQSPVWVPDSQATHCMVCSNTEFTVLHRRHHCRNCGKLVCNKCSQYRWVLPSQGPNKLRICRCCHELLGAQQEESRQASNAAINACTITTSSLISPSQRIPINSPPNWQQNEETRNEDGDDLESDSSIYLNDYLSTIHFPE